MEENKRFELINIVRLAKGKYMPIFRVDNSFTDEMFLERLIKCFEVDGYPYIKHPKAMSEMLLNRCYDHGLFKHDSILELIKELHPLKNEFLPNLDLKGNQYNDKSLSAIEFDFRIIQKCLDKLTFVEISKLGYTNDEYETHKLISELVYVYEKQ